MYFLFLNTLLDDDVKGDDYILSVYFQGIGDMLETLWHIGADGEGDGEGLYGFTIYGFTIYCSVG